MATIDTNTEGDLASPKQFFLKLAQVLQLIEQEKRRSGDGVWTRQRKSTEDVEDPVSGFIGTPAEVFLTAFKVFEELVQCLIRGDHVPDHEQILLSVLAICLRQALEVNSANCKSLMNILANASRLPRWRKPFGTAVQHPYRYDPMPKAEQPPDTVLLVALGILTGPNATIAEDVLGNALRLINNCCQDDDGNCQIALDQNGVSYMMSLAYRRVEPDLVVPALYNICVDHERATNQLVHWKGESPDIGAGPRLEDGFRESSPSKGALEVLLNLVDALWHEERKPLLADLLEIASQSVVQDLNGLPVGNSGDGDSDRGRIGLLTQLMFGPGSRLAASNTECRLAVCNTLTNLLSHEIFRKSLIFGNLVRPFLSMAYPYPPESSRADPELDEDAEAESNLLQCRQGVLKALYSICAMPEFTTAYPLGTELVTDCLTSVREPHLANTKYDAKYDGELLPLSGACVILTSLTQSEQIARSLVEDHRVHERLPELLHNIDDQDILYPAINFVGRLALPAANKPILVQHGLLVAMCRFFAQDATPSAQREAAIAVRRMVTGSPEVLTITRRQGANPGIDPAAKDNELVAALALFQRTDDASLQLEVGRLAIEICRIVWKSADGRPENAEENFSATVGSYGQSFGDAIAFVILHGENPGARGEGWFGFAMMSVWVTGRALIRNCLNREAMLAEVKKVVASGGGPAYQNLRVLLTKMDTLPKDAFLPETQRVLENAAEQMGLAQIWPKQKHR